MNTYSISYDGSVYLFRVKSSTYYATVIPIKTTSDAHQFEEILKRNGYAEVEDET